jgi:uncharacterized protein YjiS (DUF1127 family)
MIAKKINHFFSEPCVTRLAAPQHRNCRSAWDCLIFGTTKEPALQGLNRQDKENPMLLSLIRMVKAFRDYQRNVSELSQLSDRELADIGLDRSDIPRVAAGSYQG